MENPRRLCVGDQRDCEVPPVGGQLTRMALHHKAHPYIKVLQWEGQTDLRAKDQRGKLPHTSGLDIGHSLKRQRLGE